ncbi:unnamed protein product [Menidia menidia]|uniref:(Atlantic silverside) hypothetical protein n=1 Tax=Menidia menidia TaxID=238744 RepID=A0A8S4BUA4_9TELE|nr:unnamed protein product [Menidia menidia]
MARVQYPPPQSWRPQLGQSATALVPPRVMGRSPRPISTLQEVTSEDEDRERPPEAPRAATPHFLSPQPAPRQRSFSCTQHALQRRSAGPQPEPNYLIVTDRVGSGETSERAPVVVLAPPPPDAVQHAVIQNERHPPGNAVIQPGNADPPQAAPGGEQKARGERLNNGADSRQTAL